MSAKRAELIDSVLTKAFAPDHLLVKDQSHLHTGHAGAKDGRGHFAITIVAEAFDGLGRIESHRLVYAALGALMTTDIHALSINASAKNAN